MADALAARSEKDGGGKIDCLIHVAGVLGLDELGKLDFDDVHRQIEINTIGPLRAIEAALPYLAADARVGIVTSRVGSLVRQRLRADVCLPRLESGREHGRPQPAPRSVEARASAVAALHPGMVATDLTKDFSGRLPVHHAGRGGGGTDPPDGYSRPRDVGPVLACQRRRVGMVKARASVGMPENRTR